MGRVSRRTPSRSRGCDSPSAALTMTPLTPSTTRRRWRLRRFSCLSSWKRTTLPALAFGWSGSATRRSADTKSMCTSSPPMKSLTCSLRPTFLCRICKVWHTELSATILSRDIASANHRSLPAMWFWNDRMSRSTSTALVWRTCAPHRSPHSWSL